jgi:divalent metal cation (Fe/Co/Zn/Cd) transporter
VRELGNRILTSLMAIAVSTVIAYVAFVIFWELFRYWLNH